MLQQSHTPSTQSSNQSSLLQTSSPQSDSTDAVQGTANQQLLQSEQQNIIVPSSASSTEQTSQVVITQGDVLSDTSFQPIEIIGIFVVVILAITVAAFYTIKKSKNPEAAKDSPVNHLSDISESSDAALGQTHSTAPKKRNKKLTRRQRQQQKQRP